MTLARTLLDSRGNGWHRLHASALGLAAAIGLWGAGGWRWNVWIAPASVAFLVAGIALDQGRRRRETAVNADLRSFVTRTAQVGSDVLPVWSAHIENSRSQMEVAVAALAQRFASIVERLEQALKSSVQSGEQGLAGVFEQSAQELRSVLDSLSEAMARNRAMTSEVQNLGRFIDELQAMAAEVANIAAQTNLLAINAAIEAAHAGENGRSFGVLAQEVRKLSAMSGETGTRMAQKVATISTAIETARQAAEQSAQREEAASTASEAAITGVLDGFRKVTHELETSAGVLKQESIGIQSEIVDALIQLQFQDRVSQRMTHVRHNIERLPVLLADSQQHFERSGALVPVDGAALLAELHDSYAMEDERATHGSGVAQARTGAGAQSGGNSSVASPGSAAGADTNAHAVASTVEEVTFF
jgi:methyl-accepting chemotaxis protein